MTNVEVTAKSVDREDEILTPEALGFVGDLHTRFRTSRNELLDARRLRRGEVGRAGQLGFLPETAHIRSGEWTVAAAPADLLDRRVEITGPPERKMAINALNSGARVWLADLEDANSPTWDNLVTGQVNLTDAIRRRIAITTADGRVYQIRTDRPTATIVMRPRGWHLPERHVLVDGEPAVAALVDFG